MIPHVFHQIWLGGEPLPAEFEEYQETWRQHHPHWNLRLWTEEDLPEGLRRGEVYERKRSPAERSDILRLELLWQLGGVYVDTDMECLKPIDQLLEGIEFFAGHLKEERVNNAIFGAAPEHPLLEQALRKLRPQKIGARFDKTASGALFFNSIVMKQAPAGGLILFPPHFFYPSTPSERERAFAIHHAARSWKNADEWRETALKAEARLDDARRELDAERRAHRQTRAALEELERSVALGEGTRPLRILFFLRSIHYDRVFENFLRALLERGHQVHVVLSLEKRGLGDDKTRLFDEFAARHQFTYEKLTPRRDKWVVPAVALRHGLDYLRYLEPEFAHAHPLRARARARAPFAVRALLSIPPFRTRVGRRLVRAVLRTLEQAMPVPRSTKRLIESHQPDVVLASPLVGLGSIEVDHVRAAHELGIPTVLVVASWDNLSNKGELREIPTLTVVWNETQVREAVQLHGVPSSRVVAVGAHSFDHWFDWEPSTTREEFAQKLGLDPERPLIVYLGSSNFISGDETRFIRKWLKKLREDPRIGEAAVILRPHPQNLVGWAKLKVDEPGRTVVWPREGAAPTDDDKKADFYDTIYHSSALVGINTTALIEAAILGRPVLTLVSDHFETQTGTLHFSYIAGDGGEGLVTVGRSWEQHLEQIADAIESPDGHLDRCREFVGQFVRPRGREIPAAPVAVDAVERAAASRVAPRQVPALQPILKLFTPALAALLVLLQPRRTWRTSTKAFRKLLKRARKQRHELRRRTLRPAKQSAAKAPVAPGDAELLLRELERLENDSRQVEALSAEDKARIRRAKEKEKARREAEKARARRKKPAAAGRARPVSRKAGARAYKRIRKSAKLARRRWKYTKRWLRSVYNMRHRRTYGLRLDRVPSRDEIPVLLNARGLLGRGAEIGVKTGRFSEHLLRTWRGNQLISIDPWLSADPDEYVDRSNVSQAEFEEYYRETKQRLSAFGERSTIWRTTSVEAAAKIENQSLDFVYIDARHDYDSVKEDLHAWLPKVRPGGILAGHDYADGLFPQGDFGVKSAVDEFFAERAISVHSTDGPSAVELFPSWIVEVPDNSERPAEVEATAMAGEAR